MILTKGVQTGNDVEGIDPIHFGTDGWRAIIDKDFNHRSVARVADAVARVFRAENPRDNVGDASKPNTILIGYDTRRDAGRYAALAATIIASHGFNVQVSRTYCPTPALCWSVSVNPAAAGGMMLTSSHNPAEYLGVKVRMVDGGAAPSEFTDRIEAVLEDELPQSFPAAVEAFENAVNGTTESPADASLFAFNFQYADLMSPYLQALLSTVDSDVITKAGLRVVVDPLFGAGRRYLAQILDRLGVTVEEIHAAQDPTFAGLHPEPIPPWIDGGSEKVKELGFDACFITDGDADRIAAIDGEGCFVSPQRILTLLIAHLAEDKQRSGRVVRTVSGSNLIKRQCDRLGLELATTPIGFKWIYAQMKAGDVLIGGEEGGGIGIPTHVFERDGLLMALLVVELMAERKMSLRQLTEDMLLQLGNLDYDRRDLKLTAKQKQDFLDSHVDSDKGAEDYAEYFAKLGETIVSVNRLDGIKLDFASDAWLLMRPSGTEPLVRVYAEAATKEQLDALLDVGCALAKGEYGF